MERWNRSGAAGRAVAVFMVVVVLMLANDLNAQTYQCWGGCYNECVLSNDKPPPLQRFPCYFQCILDKCTQSYPSDFQFYCQVGCSLGLCSLSSYDAAEVQKCYGSCSDVCKKI